MLSPTGLIPWFSKSEEILMLLCCITLSSSRENQRSAQEVARRISGAVAGEATQKSTYQVPIINSHVLHYIILHLSLVFLSPTSKMIFENLRLCFAALLFDLVLPCAFFLLASLLAKNLLLWIHLSVLLGSSSILMRSC